MICSVRLNRSGINKLERENDYDGCGLTWAARWRETAAAVGGRAPRLVGARCPPAAVTARSDRDCSDTTE